MSSSLHRCALRSRARVALLLFAVSAPAHAGWVTLASNVNARQEVAVAAANGKVYLIGGIDSDPDSSAIVEAYDPISNTWSLAALLPEPLHHTAAVTFEDQIYVLGGYRTIFFDPTNAAYRYDPRSNTWSPIARMPFPRGAHAAAVIGERIYVVGGVGPSSPTLLAYEPRNDRWITLPELPTSREHLTAGTVNGKLYVAGGRAGGNRRELEEYDPETNTWASRAPMPTARSGIAGAVVGGRFYVFGGEGNPANPLGTFAQNESYDPVTDSWRTEAPMPTPRHGIAAATIGRVIYLPGGAPVQAFGVTTRHEAFIPGRRERPVRH